MRLSEISFSDTPVANSIGGDEQFLVVENSQIKTKQVSTLLADQAVVTANIDAVTGGMVVSGAGEANLLDALGVRPTWSDAGKVRPGVPLVMAFTDTGSIVKDATVSVAVATRRGRRCLELTYTNAAPIQLCAIPIPSAVYTDKVSFCFEVETAAEWNGGYWRPGLYTASDRTRGMKCVTTVGTASGWSGVHEQVPRNSTIYVTAPDWTQVGAGAFSDTMTYFGFDAQRKAGATGTTRIWLYEATDGKRANNLPMIIFGADDGHSTWYSAGLPVLEAYGFPSYLSYINKTVGTVDYMSAADWLDAEARGHYSVVHGCSLLSATSLRDYFTTYTGYDSPQAAMQADIMTSINGMIANGLDLDRRGRKVYVYPQGIHQPTGGAGDNTIINALTACGITTARLATIFGGMIQGAAQEQSRLYLPIIGHNYAGGSEATNIANLVTEMQHEVNAGRSVVFMFHKVVGSPAIAEEITAANLTTIVAAAASLVNAGAARPGRLTDFADELDVF